MSELISSPQSEPGLEAARAGSDTGPDRLQQPTIVVRYDAAFDPSDRSGEVDGDGPGADSRPRRGRAAHPGIPRCPGTRPPRDDVGPHAGGLSLSAMGRGDRVLDPDPGCHRPHAAGQADAQGGHLPAGCGGLLVRLGRQGRPQEGWQGSRAGSDQARECGTDPTGQAEGKRDGRSKHGEAPAAAPPLDAAPAPSSPIAVAGPANSTVAEGTSPPPDSTTTNKESVPAPPPLTAQTGASAPRRCDGRPDPGARTADTPPDGIPGNADGPGRVGATSESGTSAPPGPRGQLATDSCADRVGPAGECDPRTTGGIGSPGDRRGSEADRRGRCRECACRIHRIRSATGCSSQRRTSDSAIPAQARFNRPGLVARTRSREPPAIRSSGADNPATNHQAGRYSSTEGVDSEARTDQAGTTQDRADDQAGTTQDRTECFRAAHRANPDRERRPGPGHRGSRTAWRSRRPSTVNKAHLNRPTGPRNRGQDPAPRDQGRRPRP